MAKLGILGGTFNPIHNGHLQVAAAAMDEYGLDRVMFMPNFQPPHKQCDFMASSKLRLSMAEAAVSENHRFFVSDFEIKRGGVSYLADTLRELKKVYFDELYFIIGGDSLKSFTSWYKPEEIASRCTLLAYPRDKVDLSEYMENLRKTLNAKVFPLNAPLLNVSSSEIRSRVKEGKSIEGLVPPKVLEIINNNGLYKG